MAMDGDLTAVDVKTQSIILAFSAMVWLLPDNKDSWLSCKAVDSSQPWGFVADFTGKET